MNLSQARDIILVQSMEEADPNGNVLATSEIQQAQSEAGAPREKKLSETGEYVMTSEAEGFLIRRAAGLKKSLIKDHPQLGEILGGSSWNFWAPVLILAAAFLLGLSTNGLGQDRAINILSFPIIGMVLWNLVVFAVIGFRALFARGNQTDANAAKGQGFIPAQRKASPFIRLVIWLTGWRDRHAQASEEESLRNTILAKGSARFVTDWVRCTANINLSRASVVLHLGAALIALGAIVGMYGKALTFEYVAVWESTYLTKDSLHRVLQSFLGPASFISGIGLPSPDELEKFRHPEGDNAGKWLHLYAVTAGIFIVAPRLLLALWGWMRERHQARHFHLPETSHHYFQDVLRGVYGEVQSVRIYSYSFEPSGRTRDLCKELAHSLWGGRLDIELLDTIPYGMEDDVLEKLTPATLADHLVVLMNLSASPEAEIHGRLVQGLHQLAVAAQGKKNSLLVLLDPSSFEKKFSDLPEYDRRFEERVRTWERILKDNDVQPVLLTQSSIQAVHDVAQSCKIL